MSIKRGTAILVILFSVMVQAAFAQFILNMNNGLPTNHVYRTVKDRYNYLWIATPKGLVKYNGYSCKTLFNGDVWDLFEDKKGRMWLSTFSNEIGYIYQDKYYKTVVLDSEPTFAPIVFNDYDDGVFFYSNYRKSNNLCFERNDTVRIYNIKKYAQLLLPDKNLRSDSIHGDIVASKSGIRCIKLDGYYKLTICNGHLTLKFVHELETNFFNYRSNIVGQFWDYHLQFNLHETKMMFLDLKDFKQKNILFSNDPQEYIYVAPIYDSTFFCVITNKKTYVIDKNLNIQSSYSLRQLLGSKGAINDFITFFYIDHFWGNWISQTNKGTQANICKNYFSKPYTSELSDFKYLGASFGRKYLWNEIKKELLIEKGGNYQSKHLPLLRNPLQIIPIDTSRSLVVSNDALYTLFRTNEIDSFFKKKRIELIINNASLHKDIVGNRRACVTKDGSIFLLSRSQGLNYLCTNGNIITNTIIDERRFDNLEYDSLRNLLYAYDGETILIYSPVTKRKSVINKTALSALGITKVDKILVDNKHGNIFIKDLNNLFLFNPDKAVFKRLFHNIVFNNASIALEGNRFIAAGKFGVLFVNIDTAGKLSKPVVYYNIKNSSYYYVNDIRSSGDKLVLNTNSGLYDIMIPAQNSKEHTYDKVYKFIAMCNGNLKNIKTGDTLTVTHKSPYLKFDVVNPSGTGMLKFSYSMPNMNDRLKELNSDELALSFIKPGKYYNLSVLAMDDVWRSAPLNIIVYLQPFWWETSWGKNLLTVAIILLAALIILTTIILTRQHITTKNAKKNRLLELELKSIYSQINPHFIFNTLNSGLHFIKKQKIEEAYNHLFRFSKLLRSYLKSARHRYINLADEITNLKDYIELQQTRFGNIFTYEINLHNIGNPNEITIPSLLLQPIVENAINHGLLPNEKKGHLIIAFTNAPNELICKIEDNGIGYSRSKDLQSDIEKKESYGNDLIKELVAIFNEYEKISIRLEYIEKQLPETGTIVLLYISTHHGKIQMHNN